MTAADPRVLPTAQPVSRLVRLGLFAVVFGFFGVLVWSLSMTLSGAVIAPGIFVAESEVKRVQHQQGGIVGDIRVQNGSRVRAGEVLVRLDDTQARANLGLVTVQLTQFNARRSRLEADRDDRSEISLGPDFFALAPEAAEVAASEQRLMREMRAMRAAQKDQLLERIGQFRQEIEGLSAQSAAKSREIELILGELKGVEELFLKNLVPISRYNALQREAARLSGEQGQLVALIAKARGQIAETELQILGIDQNARTEAVKELRDVESQIAQLQERRIAALDTLQRVDIRSPQDGVVHELQVVTLGGVVAPGGTLMLIVPDQDRLTIEAKIATTDIDLVRVGQKVHLRLVALNQRLTPEILGEVTRVAPDLSREQQTGVPYFTVRMRVLDSEIRRLGGQPLVSGMPVEAMIQTGERSAFFYFLRPLLDAFARTFREE
jgi:HlyD family secretion protein